MPDSLDPRTQTLALPSDGVGRLTVSPSTGLFLTMQPDERIDTVVLGDPGAFSVQVDGASRELTIRALRAGASSTLSVMSSARAYYFELEAGEAPSAAARVRLVPAPGLAPLTADQGAGTKVANTADAIVATYSLSGDRPLRPVSVEDDGERTYIEWGVDQALPAVFGVGPTGAEEVADGHMRDGYYVLDRIWPRLVFRMDDARAKARRILPKSRP